MKWALIAVGVVVALVVVVVIVGALLPRDHVAIMRARIAAPQRLVWQTLTDPAGYPSWRRELTSVEILPPTPTGPSWREHSKSGTLTFVVDSAEPAHQLTTRIADHDLPFGGTWTYLVEPDGDSASTVTIVEKGSVYNPVFRFVSRFIMGHTATIDAYLRALSKRFGPEARPIKVTVVVHEIHDTDETHEATDGI